MFLEVVLVVDDKHACNRTAPESGVIRELDKVVGDRVHALSRIVLPGVASPTIGKPLDLAEHLVAMEPEALPGGLGLDKRGDVADGNIDAT